MDPLLDEEVLDLLLVTFNAMDGLLPDEDLKGKINVAKGLEVSTSCRLTPDQSLTTLRSGQDRWAVTIHNSMRNAWIQ